MRNLWLEPFDANREFVARRRMTVGDKSLAPGDGVDKAAISKRRLRQLFDQRVIVFKDVWEKYVAPPKKVVEQPEQPAAPVALPGLPGVTDEPIAEDRDTLVKDAESLGIKVDGRWGIDRLRAEIDKALENGGTA